MPTITLICTTHKAAGNCNVDALYYIIKQILPEVIFEELSYENYDRIYHQGSLSTLESNAVKLYMHSNEVEHIPIDTYSLPKTYYDDLDRLLDKVFQSNNIVESHTVRNLADAHKNGMTNYGFSYLNSDGNDHFFEKFNFLKGKILDALNDEDLFRIYELEKEMIEKREYEMIKNIYNYSKDNSYNKGLFFIGAGHRKSIIAMIRKFEQQEMIELNWMIL